MEAPNPEEGMRLLANADAEFARMNLARAATLYAAASRALAGDARASTIAAGYHHYACALLANNENKHVSALSGLSAAATEFKRAGEQALHDAMIGLAHVFQAMHDAGRDKHERAQRELSEGARILQVVRTSRADFRVGCEVWLLWAQLVVAGSRFVDEVDDLQYDAAEGVVGRMRRWADSLTKRCPEHPIKGFFSSLVDMYEALYQLTRATDDADEFLFQNALVWCARAHEAVVTATQNADALRRDPELSTYARLFDGMRIMVLSVDAQIRAREQVFLGDTVGAMASLASALKELERLHSEMADQADEAGFAADAEDYVDDARALYQKVAARDPQLLTYEPQLRAILSPDVADAVLSDLREASNAVMHQQWLSANVLCGSVLEAVFYALLKPRETEARATKDAPSVPLERWELGHFVRAARALRLLPEAVLSSADSVREFRNLIHAGKRVREGWTVGKEQVDQAVAALKVVIGAAAKKMGEA